MSTDLVAFSDLARAAYCPRQLYYARREDDRSVPDEVRERMDLAFRYPALRASDREALATEPIAVSPDAYRAALARLARRPVWAALVNPARRRVTLSGRDCRGRVGKVLDRVPAGDGADTDGAGEGGGVDEVDPPGAGDGSAASTEGPAPVPVLLSPGDPPEYGVWEPQRVRAVAAAKALAWERERPVPRALVEYPAHAVVRTVRLTTGNRAQYRQTLRTVRSLGDPPARTEDTEKCGACEYRETCGTRTRSLRSLLGL